MQPTGESNYSKYVELEVLEKEIYPRLRERGVHFSFGTPEPLSATPHNFTVFDKNWDGNWRPKTEVVYSGTFWFRFEDMETTETETLSWPGAGMNDHVGGSAAAIKTALRTFLFYYFQIQTDGEKKQPSSAKKADPDRVDFKMVTQMIKDNQALYHNGLALLKAAQNSYQDKIEFIRQAALAIGENKDGASAVLAAASATNGEASKSIKHLEGRGEKTITATYMTMWRTIRQDIIDKQKGA